MIANLIALVEVGISTVRYAFLRFSNYGLAPNKHDACGTTGYPGKRRTGLCRVRQNPSCLILALVVMQLNKRLHHFPFIKSPMLSPLISDSRSNGGCFGNNNLQNQSGYSHSQWEMAISSGTCQNIYFYFCCHN